MDDNSAEAIAERYRKHQEWRAKHEAKGPTRARHVAPLIREPLTPEQRELARRILRHEPIED
jgi:hypothetical protein